MCRTAHPSTPVSEAGRSCRRNPFLGGRGRASRGRRRQGTPELRDRHRRRVPVIARRAVGELRGSRGGPRFLVDDPCGQQVQRASGIGRAWSTDLPASATPQHHPMTPTGRLGVAVSINQVAQHAGVSIGTVSNVLNRPEIVAETTRRRVLDAIATLGFVRNEAARSLRAGSTRTVGLVVLDVANPFFTDLAAGVEAVADQHGTSLSLCNSGESRERERRHLEHLNEQRVQGVLITPLDTSNPDFDRLVARGIPVVLVDRGSGEPNRCSVAVDDLQGGGLVGEHLASQGHRRVAFVGGPLSIKQVADRHRGLTQSVDGADVDVSLELTEALTIAEGLRCGESLARIPASRRPTAVACANDLLALGVLQAFTTAGLRIPQDVAIVGYDDIVYAGAAAVPLSSVRQPRALLGQTGAELLFEEIAQPEAHRHRQIVFEPELVVRASSDHRRRASRKTGRLASHGDQLVTQ